MSFAVAQNSTDKTNRSWSDGRSTGAKLRWDAITAFSLHEGHRVTLNNVNLFGGVMFQG